MKITKDTLIADILKSYPDSMKVFEAYHMGCFSCMGVQKETLERGCMMHGIDVEELIKKLDSLS